VLYYWWHQCIKGSGVLHQPPFVCLKAAVATSKNLKAAVAASKTFEAA
jgi:hypothetical protein